MMRESMTTFADGETNIGTLLPSCIGGRASIIPGLGKRKKKKKLGNCLGQDNDSVIRDNGGIVSSDSDDEESRTENTVNKNNGQSSDSEQEPEEFEVTNADGTVTKMITTASGPIPLDFSNTKIIQDGKVFNINDLSAFSHGGNNGDG